MPIHFLDILLLQHHILDTKIRTVP